ncbi:MAG TPA: type II secretion system major pseudopilin GspG [Gallionellaceae bacterium]
MASRMSRHTRQAGFTLMELLLVLVIIGLLAAVVGPSLYQRIKPAKETAARAQIENFATALDNFMMDTGRYPTTQEGLKALRNKPDNLDKWNGPYLKKELPDDPWGTAYQYRAPGRSGGYEIVSFGADGKEGGEGDNVDINSWETQKK